MAKVDATVPRAPEACVLRVRRSAHPSAGVGVVGVGAAIAGAGASAGAVRGVRRARDGTLTVRQRDFWGCLECYQSVHVAGV